MLAAPVAREKIVAEVACARVPDGVHVIAVLGVVDLNQRDGSLDARIEGVLRVVGLDVREVQGVALGPSCPGPTAAQKILHNAEYYILEAQNGERWAAEDAELDKRLAELREKHGGPPNIIQIMWDDTSFGWPWRTPPGVRGAFTANS